MEFEILYCSFFLFLGCKKHGKDLHLHKTSTAEPFFAQINRLVITWEIKYRAKLTWHNVWIQAFLTCILYKFVGKSVAI